jgi:hypothetical protein
MTVATTMFAETAARAGWTAKADADAEAEGTKRSGRSGRSGRPTRCPTCGEDRRRCRKTDGVRCRLRAFIAEARANGYVPEPWCRYRSLYVGRRDTVEAAAAYILGNPAILYWSKEWYPLGSAVAALPQGKFPARLGPDPHAVYQRRKGWGLNATTAAYVPARLVEVTRRLVAASTGDRVTYTRNLYERVTAALQSARDAICDPDVPLDDVVAFLTLSMALGGVGGAA